MAKGEGAAKDADEEELSAAETSKPEPTKEAQKQQQGADIQSAAMRQLANEEKRKKAVKARRGVMYDHPRSRKAAEEE